MTIPLPVDGAIDILGEGVINAFDRTVANVGGRRQDTDGSPYTFSGSIQTADDKTLRRLGQGFQSGGTLVIRTRQTLYFIDTSSPAGAPGNNENRQTFINHFGEMWRVHSLGNWRPTGSYRKYIAIKHVER